MRSSNIITTSALFLALHLILSVAGGDGDSFRQLPAMPEILPLDNLLSFSFYHKSCPAVEAIIHKKLSEWVDRDPTLAASLLRLFFHDCSVTGCDASILLNHEGSERSAEASKTLRGFEVIDDIKAEVEKRCPRTVSCADILSGVTREASVMLGGPYWAVPYGRRDSLSSFAKDAQMVPMGRENLTSLLEFVQSRGLNVLDLVVLSGAHTIGRTSCGAIQHRLYGGKQADPTVDGKYLNFLQRKCRWASEYVDLDATTPSTFDAEYYSNLQKHLGTLSTDQMLHSDPRTSPIVSAFINNPSMFKHQFGVSMAKLANVQVLTGQDQGQIRTNCNLPNSY